MHRRPPDPTKISLDDLQPGDIMLSTGPTTGSNSSWLDYLIRTIDDSDYSHATEYIGKVGEKHMVVEATTDGILYDCTKLDFDAQPLIDAYRFVSHDKHQFGEANWPSEPVTKMARTFVGGKYAYSELIMLGLVIMAADLPDDDAISEIIRLGAGFLVNEISKWINQNADKTPMTCVQVVTTAHWQAEASPANKYAIDVQLRRKPKSDPTSKSHTEFRKLQSEIKQVFDNAPQLKPLVQDPALESGLIIPAGSAALPAGTCTLHDLQTSPCWKFLGYLKQP